MFALMSRKDAGTYLGHLNTTLQMGIYLRIQAFETLLLIVVTFSHLADTCLKSTTKTPEQHLSVDVFAVVVAINLEQVLSNWVTCQ